MPLRSNRLLERAFRAGLFSRSTWLPTSLGSSLAAWYKADAGCYTDAACLFASASSQYLSKTSPTFAPTTKMTIAFDYKPSSGTIYHGVCSRRDTGGTQNQFVVYINNAEQVAVILYADGAGVDYGFYTGSTTLSVGTNYRVVIDYDGTQSAGSRLAIYVNGVAETLTLAGGTGAPASLPASTAPLTVGADGAGPNQFCNGALARLGFSSLALSGAALTAAHTSTFWADMTAARQADWFSFYNLCEASSTRVDSTGLNNLTPTNGPTVAAGPGEGLATNNSPVKRWEDQSGNARHLLQATIAKQPLWMAAIQNGRPGILADGVDDVLSVAVVKAQPVTIFVAGKILSANGADAVFLYDGAGGPAIQKAHGGGSVWDIYSGAFLDSATATDALAHAFSAVFNGASSKLRLDGAEIASGDAGSAGLISIDLFGLALPMNGYIYEFLDADGVLSAGSITSVESYLKARWATP